ncbi:glycosyltransferase family 2 protein [Actinomycetaceae bacterium MB13-C1-2]|nr:glycosyltransferase family 2 protein [Actinomycetaceae bacterium MB13-C1-2]
MSKEKVSLFLVCYNQENYIGEAVRSALKQTYSPLEVVISDDHSRDRTFCRASDEVRAYSGPHSVSVHRNGSNLGMCANFNQVMNMTSGSIVVGMDGDDIADPDYVKRMVAAFEDAPDGMGVGLGFQKVDAESRPVGSPFLRSPERWILSDWKAKGNLLTGGPARAYRRSVMDFFGPLMDDAQTIDSTMVLRCLMLGGFIKGGRSRWTIESTEQMQLWEEVLPESTGVRYSINTSRTFL